MRKTKTTTKKLEPKLAISPCVETMLLLLFFCAELKNSDFSFYSDRIRYVEIFLLFFMSVSRIYRIHIHKSYNSFLY